jgi:hypothetical protein
MCGHSAKSRNGLCIPSKNLNIVHRLENIKRPSDFHFPGNHMIKCGWKLNPWFPCDVIAMAKNYADWQYSFSYAWPHVQNPIGDNCKAVP